METRTRSGGTGSRPSHRDPRRHPATPDGRPGIHGRRRAFAPPANDNTPPLRHLIARLTIAALVGIAASAATLILLDRLG